MECSPPAHYTTAQVVYTNSVCRNKFVSILHETNNSKAGSTSAIVFHLSDIDKIPKRSDAISLEREDIIPKGVSVKKSDGGDGLTLYWYVIAQLVVASVGYLFILQVAPQSNIEQPQDGTPVVLNKQMKGKKLCLLNVTVFVLACVAWLTLACLCYINVVKDNNSNEEDFQTSGVAMCDYTLRRIGNVQHVTIQCAYSVLIPATHSDNDLKHVAATANTTLGFLMFVLWGFVGLITMVFAHSGASRCSDYTKEPKVNEEELKPI